jgi:hypothetical protein
VTEDEVIAEGIEVIQTKVKAERLQVFTKCMNAGLVEDEAHALYRRWFADHLEGGPSPLTAMRNDLADKSVRNIAAVWRARLAAPYNPGHGTQTQVVEAGAAGRPR